MSERRPAGGLSRRAAMKGALAGLGLLGLGGAGLALWPTVEADAPDDLLVLSPRAWVVLSAVAEAVCPSGGAWPSAAALGVAQKIDKLMAGMPKEDADQLVLGLLLLENALAGLALDGRVGPFSAAPLPARRAAFTAWQQSALPVRKTAFKALRGLCASAYFADPRTAAAVGYGGPPDLGQASAPAIQAAQPRALWAPEAVAPTDMQAVPDEGPPEVQP